MTDPTQDFERPMTALHLSSSCTLLIIDVQERLLGAMDPDKAAAVVKQSKTLVELAGVVGAQVYYTEQYPRGLGRTESSLLETLQGVQATGVEKVHFDACAAPEFQEHLQQMRRRVIVCGMETHICVQATACSLINHGKDVQIPFDAVCSRSERYEQNGLDVMSKAGAVITNTESLVFGTLGYSQHPEFKRFSKMIQ